MTSAKRDHIVRFGAWLVLLAALLPNISYMGHWSTASPTPAHDHHSHSRATTTSDTDDHISHCHAGPAHCGGGESMIGTPFVGEDSEDAVSLPGIEAQLHSGRDLARVSGHASIDLQPPQSV